MECVVVCEADADCRFFAAVRDGLSLDPAATRRSDLMFTHCGGKARLAVVIRALREVGVPVKAIADFDILSDEQPLRNSRTSGRVGPERCPFVAILEGIVAGRHLALAPESADYQAGSRGS